MRALVSDRFLSSFIILSLFALVFFLRNSRSEAFKRHLARSNCVKLMRFRLPAPRRTGSGPGWETSILHGGLVHGIHETT